MNFVKPSVPMAVPDSVLRFNLEFDSSVFDNPFKGAYEFRPFLTEMELAGSTSLQKKLYLRAGAGYSLHPELDFVWTPLRNDSFRLSVYARHRSYVGDYRSLTPALSDGSLEIDSGNSRFYGYDLVSRGGIDGVYDWDGNHVCDLSADIPLLSICVSADDSYLIGLYAEDYVLKCCRFDLPERLRE